MTRQEVPVLQKPDSDSRKKSELDIHFAGLDAHIFFQLVISSKDISSLWGTKPQNSRLPIHESILA